MRTPSPRSLALLAACLVGLAHALSPTARAADNPYIGKEQARQALAVIQSDAPPGEKAVACKRLAVFGGPEAVPALAKFLTDPQLASWARIPLEAIPGPEADAALREALPRLQGNLLIGVVNSLGVRRDAKAVDPLVLLQKDPDAQIASAAALALGKIGNAPALAALETALPAAPTAVRSAVAEGLILCAERAASGGQGSDATRLYDLVRRADVPPQRALEATRGAILARGADGLPLLIETLRAPEAPRFAMGLRVVRELPGRAVTEALAAELERTPADRQSALLLALTDRADDAVWPAVLNAAKQGSKALRLVAIAALDRQGSPTSVPTLLEAATATDSEVAKAAKEVLGRLPGTNVDTALLARLTPSTGPAKQVLVELAGKRRILGAVPALLDVARGADAALRSAAIQSLGESVSADAFQSLADLVVKAGTEDEIGEVEAALDSAAGRLPEKTALSEALLARLNAPRPAERAALLRVLGTLGTSNGLGGVRVGLQDPDASVRDAAFRVLADWPDPAAVPALVDVIRKPANDTQRTLALRGAVRLLGTGNQPSGSTVKTYTDLLSLASRVDDRKLVLSGLGAVPDPAAARLVEPLLAEVPVRKEAESALLSIASALAGSAPDEAKKLATRLKADASDAAIRDRAAQVLQRMDQYEDYLTTWQFAGAYTLFAGEQGSLFAKEFPPEKSDDKVNWRPLPAGTQAAKPWMLDLLATKTAEARCAGYVRTWVYSEKAQAARIEFGTDDGHKLWLNGERIAQADRGGAAVPGEFKTTVSLREGWNLVLLKVVQDSGPWEFCLRFRSPGGDRLQGLRVQATPPEK